MNRRFLTAVVLASSLPLILGVHEADGVDAARVARVTRVALIAVGAVVGGTLLAALRQGTVARKESR